MGEANLVVVDAFGTEMEAELARGALHAAGIDSLIQADSAGGTRPHIAFSTGGYKLLVREEDEAVARALLKPIDEAGIDDRDA
jgi:hypothetical protein